MPVVSRRPKVEPKKLECPHDGSVMVRLLIAKVEVDRCETCGGTWFDAKELRRVTRDHELERMATRVGVAALPSGFLCPRCGNDCIRSHVAEVPVDTCSTCRGVWLDRGELVEAQRRLKAERLLAAGGDGFRAFLARL